MQTALPEVNGLRPFLLQAKGDLVPMNQSSQRAARDDTARDDDILDDVIYSISHDLRASIRAMRELPEWLKEDLAAQGVDLAGEPDELLGLMQDHARRLDAMLAGLLAYSRVGRLQEVVTVEPQVVFKQVVGALLPPEDTDFYCHFNAVPVRMGQADIAKIFEVILSNAMSFGKDESGSRIEVTSCRSGDVWELMVADNGPGIPSDQIEDAMKPMRRLSAKAEDPTAGMGLFILDRIVRQYKGEVLIETRRRRGGCLVRVRLPVLA